MAPRGNRRGPVHRALMGEFSPCKWKIRETRNFDLINSGTKFDWRIERGLNRVATQPMIQDGYVPSAYFISKQ